MCGHIGATRKSERAAAFRLLKAAKATRRGFSHGPFRKSRIGYFDEFYTLRSDDLEINSKSSLSHFHSHITLAFNANPA
jgi:hypothetical protein